MFKNAKIVGKDYDSAAYHRQDKNRGCTDFVMTRGELMLFLGCPSRWLAGYKQEGSEATEWGSIMDALVLSGESFNDKYRVVTGDEYFKSNGAWKPGAKEQFEKDTGAKPMKAKDMVEPSAAFKRLQANQRAWDLIQNSDHQVLVTGEWEHDSITVPVKCLIDIVPTLGWQDALSDYKTARSAAIDTWRREVYRNNYHVQAAFYMDLYNAATGENRESWLHVIQENIAPYEVARRMLSVEYIKLGRATYTGALKFYANCLKHNHWPSYDDVHALSVEGWTIIEPENWMIENIFATPGIDTSEEL